ncbi:MAG: hypothetical protein S4CHLAM6_00340 [Chlamydiae bacterium]|nr:hypothetical protein [Chlamydiota bacterium]
MRKKRILLVLVSIGFLLSNKINANSFYIDRNFSPHSSSNNFLQLQSLALGLQNSLTPEKSISSQDFEFSDFFSFSTLHQYSDLADWKSKGLLKIGARTAELGLVWQPLNLVTNVVQHEVFGHGYRVRDIGPKAVSVKKYTLNFGFGKKGFNVKNASTVTLHKRMLTPTEELSVQIAGMEAQTILSQNIVLDWLLKGEIDGRQASLWRMAAFNTASYVRTLRKKNGLEIFCISQVSGHDVANYLELLNQTYFAKQSIDSQIKDFRYRAMLSYIFNPFTYLSIYSELAYVLFNRPAPIPGMMSDHLKLLPAYRFALTPFGPENVFEFYIWDKGREPTYACIKSLSVNEIQYFSLGLENRRIYFFKWGSLGFKLNLWNQPKMLLNPSSGMHPYYTFFDRGARGAEFWVTPHKSIRAEKEYDREAFGGAISLIYNYGFKNLISNAFMELGYKTQGYLPGEPLLQSPIVKVGMQLKF